MPNEFLPAAASADAAGRSSVGERDLADRAAAAEALPLIDRADAFSVLHDELRTRLESGGAGA